MKLIEKIKKLFSSKLTREECISKVEALREAAIKEAEFLEQNFKQSCLNFRFLPKWRLLDKVERDILMNEQVIYVIAFTSLRLRWNDRIIFKQFFLFSKFKWSRELFKFLFFDSNLVKFISFKEEFGFSFQLPGYELHAVEVYGKKYILRDMPFGLRFTNIYRGFNEIKVHG